MDNVKMKLVCLIWMDRNKKPFIVQEIFTNKVVFLNLRQYLWLSIFVEIAPTCDLVPNGTIIP